MNKLFAKVTFLFLVIALPLSVSAKDIAKGEIVTLEISAPSLRGNLLNTPTQQKAHIYLPPSYHKLPHRKYPVIYFLHGIFDSGKTWISFSNVPSKLDSLIASGDFPEVIAVMPDAGNQYGGGFYRNSSVAGNWEDYIADDLVGTIDKNYRTIKRSGGRAAIGHSMGGYGVIHLAMERPGLFSAIYAIAPGTLDMSEDINFGNEAWTRASKVKSPDEIQAAFQSRDFWGIATFTILTTFNPAPDNPPLYVKFPFTIVNGEVIPDQNEYAALKNKFPLQRVGASQNALRQLRAFGMEYGVSEQFAHIPVSTAKFSERLNEYRIPHRLDVYKGDHRNQVVNRMDTKILPFILNVIDPPE